MFGPSQRLKTAKQNRSILSVPLTLAQRSALEMRAGTQPLSAFVRDRLFAANDNAPIDVPSARRKTSFGDRKAMAQALALLGRSELAASLQEMARLARVGALPVTPETEDALRKAANDVAEIKFLLMRGTGLKKY